MDKLQKTIDKIFIFLQNDNYENLKKNIFITVNTLILLLFIKNNYCAAITILLFMIYLKISKLSKKKKKIIIYTWILFSIFTLLGESLVILSSNNELSYKHPVIFSTPLWLITSYASMIMSIILYVDFFETMLS